MKIFKKHTLLKVLSFNSISVAVSFVTGIVLTKIVSVFLGTSGMALMGNFRNFTSMLKSVTTLGISNSVVKLVIENKDDQKELSIIYSTFFWIFILLSSVIGLSIIVFSNIISEFIFFTSIYNVPIKFFGLLLPLMVINTFWIAIYNGFEKFERIVVIQIISNIVVFLLTSFLIWKNNINGGLTAVAIGEFLMVIVTFYFVRIDKSYFKFDIQKVIDSRILKIIKKFSVMALLSAVVAPMTLILIRNFIIERYNLNNAGIWDAVNRLSGFYMMFFSSGLSMFYMPKLASLKSDDEFKKELKIYFQIFVPLFLTLMIGIFLFKKLLLQIAFTEEFRVVEDLVVWQLLGDFFRIMTLAFGFQILIKTMMKRYFIVEIVFNISYLAVSYYLLSINRAVEGVLQAYCFANFLTLIIVIWMFRKLFKF